MHCNKSLTGQRPHKGSCTVSSAKHYLGVLPIKRSPGKALLHFGLNFTAQEARDSLCHLLCAPSRTPRVLRILSAGWHSREILQERNSCNEVFGSCIKLFMNYKQCFAFSTCDVACAADLRPSGIVEQSQWIYCVSCISCKSLVRGVMHFGVQKWAALT